MNILVPQYRWEACWIAAAAMSAVMVWTVAALDAYIGWTLLAELVTCAIFFPIIRRAIYSLGRAKRFI